MAGLTASSVTRSSVAETAGRGLSGAPSGRRSPSKILYVVRHGQAVHNPRAEAAKERGCSMEEFFRLMREDDALDADLTDLGREQGERCRRAHFSPGRSGGCEEGSNHHHNNPLGIDLVVASCLSRTMDTADLVFPHWVPGESGDDPPCFRPPPRISIENFREVNGNLLNGKRRTKSELVARHPNWNFDSLRTEADESWTPEMEKYEDAAERGYRGLSDLLTWESHFSNAGSSTNTILLVCHGGILRYLMNLHPLVHLRDERTQGKRAPGDESGGPKSVESRFDNCELRKYRLVWKDDDDDDDDEESGERERRAIVLTQLDH